MDSAFGLTLSEQLDHAPDLPPPAIMDGVAQAAAALGTDRGLVRGMAAETVDELGRVRCFAAVEKKDVMRQ